MSEQVAILTAVEEGMEVLDYTRSSEPDTAFRVGEREAHKRTFLGEPTECVGVVARDGTSCIVTETGYKYHTGLGAYKREERTTFVPRIFYHPVLRVR